MQWLFGILIANINRKVKTRLFFLNFVHLPCYYRLDHHVLLLLVEHTASIKSFQALQSPAIPLTSFHDLPVPLTSSSTVLRHVLFGLPLLLYPWGFQSNAVFSIAPSSLRNVCPIQFHFLLFIRFSISFCWVILHNSSFVNYPLQSIKKYDAGEASTSIPSIDSFVKISQLFGSSNEGNHRLTGNCTCTNTSLCSHKADDTS